MGGLTLALSRENSVKGGQAHAATASGGPRDALTPSERSVSGGARTYRGLALADQQADLHSLLQRQAEAAARYGGCGSSDWMGGLDSARLANMVRLGGSRRLGRGVDFLHWCTRPPRWLKLEHPGTRDGPSAAASHLLFCSLLALPAPSSCSWTPAMLRVASPPPPPPWTPLLGTLAGRAAGRAARCPAAPLPAFPRRSANSCWASTSSLRR